MKEILLAFLFAFFVLVIGFSVLMLASCGKSYVEAPLECFDPNGVRVECPK